MRILGIVAVVALLAGPAYAESPHINLLSDTPSKTPEEKEADAVKEKAYRESLKKIPDTKVSSDPWGTVRSTDAPKAPAAAKPRTKTGNNVN
jgi:hypothetical protein